MSFRTALLLLALSGLLSSLSHGQLRYDLRLNTVPVGSVARIDKSTTEPALETVTLSNATTGSRTTGSASSWISLAGTSAIGNIASGSGSNSAGTGLYTDEILTISGDNPGENASVSFEFEIQGTFQLADGEIPASGRPAFEGSCELEFRSESSRLLSTRTVSATLRDLLAESPGPRRESGTFPFVVRTAANHLIKTGEPFPIELNFSCSASVTFGDFAGDPPEFDEFGPISNLRSLVTTGDARLFRISILNNSISNPRIEASSGADYSGLLRKPPALQVTQLGFDAATGRLVLEWETPSGASFFRILHTDDPSLPRDEWQTLAGFVGRQTSLTRYETTLPTPLPAQSFFAIEEP